MRLNIFCKYRFQFSIMVFTSKYLKMLTNIPIVGSVYYSIYYKRCFELFINYNMNYYIV